MKKLGSIPWFIALRVPVLQDTPELGSPSQLESH